MCERGCIFYLSFGNFEKESSRVWWCVREVSFGLGNTMFSIFWVFGNFEKKILTCLVVVCKRSMFWVFGNFEKKNPHVFGGGV